MRAWADYQLFTLTFPMQQLNLDDRSLAHAELDRKEQLANLGSVLRMRLVPIEFLHLCFLSFKMWLSKHQVGLLFHTKSATIAYTAVRSTHHLPRR